MSLAAYPVMEVHGERCAASCQGRREGSKGEGGRRKAEGGRGSREGGGEGEEEKGTGWGTRAVRVLEDNRRAGYDLHRVWRH